MGRRMVALEGALERGAADGGAASIRFFGTHAGGAVARAGSVASVPDELVVVVLVLLAAPDAPGEEADGAEDDGAADADDDADDGARRLP